MSEQDNDTGMQRVHVGSRPNRIAELEVGECYSESLYFDFDTTNTEILAEAEANLRNSLNKARSSATERSGNSFMLSSGRFFTSANDIIFTVVIVRTE